MSMRSSSFSSSTSTAISREIASQYDLVKVVADNIASVVINANGMANIETTAANIDTVNAIGSYIGNINIVAGIEAAIQSLVTDKATLDSLYADKVTLDSLYADKAALDSLYADKAKIDSIFADKAVLDSIFSDKDVLDSLYADKIKLDSLYADKATLDAVNAALAEIVVVANNIDDVNAIAANVPEMQYFADIYQGTKVVAPTLRNDSSVLQAGDLYYNSASKLMYAYDGAVWNAAYASLDSYTKLETQTALPKVGFDTSLTEVAGVGQLAWNATDMTLDLGVNANVTLQVGQEMVARCTNQSGSVISNGDVVAVTGAIGDKMTITKPVADGSLVEETVFGIATEDIPNNNQGMITVFGMVRGLDTSAYAEGAIMYLSSTVAGELTPTEPSIPNDVVICALVVRSHAVEGSIFVRPTLRKGAWKVAYDNATSGLTATNVQDGLDEVYSKRSTTHIPISSQLKGTYSLSNTVKTLAFDAITYTGNGTSQDIVTGVSTIDFTIASNGTGFYHDRVTGDCIVKNDAGTIVESGSIAFKDVAGVDGVCKVHIKSRGNTRSNNIYDGLRGVNEVIWTDLTNVETDRSSNGGGITAFTTTGITLGSDTQVNEVYSYISYITLYTHIKWGLTSQGKRYIEAYNPVTNDTMIMYQGSGLAGHEIPHSVGVALDFFTIKSLGVLANWNTTGTYFDYISLDATNADSGIKYTDTSSTSVINISLIHSNGNNLLNGSFVSYGKAKSKTWTIVQYTGTGVAGTFVETKDVDGVARRPARVIIKNVSSTGEWQVFDYKRGTNYIQLSTSVVEGSGFPVSASSTGFSVDNIGGWTNSSGVQYIALVEFDTDGTGTDGSYFDNPTDTTQLQLTDGLVSISNGYTGNGADNSLLVKSGTLNPIGGFIG